VINAVTCKVPDSEAKAITESGIKRAVLMICDIAMFKPSKLVKILTNELIPSVERMKVSQVMVDVGVVDISSIAYSLKSIKAVKRELALPVGCAPCNAAYKLLVEGKLSLEETRAVNCSLLTMMVLEDADFLIYGPVKAAKYAFNACATAEAIKIYSMDIEKRKLEKRHAIYTYLKNLSK